MTQLPYPDLISAWNTRGVYDPWAKSLRTQTQK